MVKRRKREIIIKKKPKAKEIEKTEAEKPQDKEAMKCLNKQKVL